MRRLKGYSYPVQVGYVALPSDIPRERYIKSVYQTGLVSVRMSDNAFNNRVPISEELIDRIVFPETVNLLGSTLLCISEPISKQIFAIAILPGAGLIKDLVEGQFRISRRSGRSIVEIVGSAIDKFLGININTQDEDGGKFRINVSNKSKTAKIEVECNGTGTIITEKKLHLQSFEEIELTNYDTEDEDVVSSIKQTAKEQTFETQTKISRNEKTVYETDRFSIGKEDTQKFIPLGEDLVQQLNIQKAAIDILFKAIQSAPVAPGDGGASFKAALITALSAAQLPNYSNVLSKISSTE